MTLQISSIVSEVFLAAPVSSRTRPWISELALAAWVASFFTSDAVVRQQESVAAWTSAGRLGALRRPALVICGEDDGMVPPENSRQIAAQIPGARLQLIPQCGHLPMLEKPGEVARLVLDFAALL